MMHCNYTGVFLPSLMY